MDATDRHNGQRDKQTNGRTDGRIVRPFVRLLDGLWHMEFDAKWRLSHGRLCSQPSPYIL